MIMFEIEDYCQVISRTWSPQLTEAGWPLLLEYPAADEQPECVIRTTVAALACRCCRAGNHETQTKKTTAEPPVPMPPRRNTGFPNSRSESAWWLGTLPGSAG